MYRFIPKTGVYMEWDIAPINIFKDDTAFSPINKKLISGDIMNNKGEVIKSPYRENKIIPGVLILSGKKYGDHKDKKLYKCVPADKKLPSFLVPYKEKSVGFSKKKVNLYILFEIKEWITKHPIGILTHVVGEVNSLENYYTYELYRTNLYETCKKFKIKSLKSVKKYKEEQKEQNIISIMVNEYHNKNKSCDRTPRKIFSIDPENTRDIDDAIGIMYSKNNNNDEVKTISIYIANVPLWLKILQLWQELTPKVSTIYLPNKKIPMLPEVLSEDICSLKENEIRLALVMDINIVSGQVVGISFENVIIKVYKNYIYEETALVKDKDYQDILSTTKSLLQQKSNYMPDINDSHDVVEYYMKMMNHQCGIKLRENKVGIFRSVKRKRKTKEDESIPHEVNKILSYWGNVSSAYVLNKDDYGHDILALDVYAQITSPIRRLVDIINMVLLQNICGLQEISEEIVHIIKENTQPESIQKMNDKMRNVKKVQTNCELINYCSKKESEKIQEGYVIQIKGEEYTIYIPQLKLITYVKTKETYEIFKKYNYSIHLFTEEDSYHKKVRVQWS